MLIAIFKKKKKDTQSQEYVPQKNGRSLRPQAKSCCDCGATTPRHSNRHRHRHRRHWMLRCSWMPCTFFLTYSVSCDTVLPCCSSSVSTNCLQRVNTSSPPSSGVPPPPADVAVQLTAQYFSFAAVVFRVVRHRVSQMKHLGITQLFTMDDHVVTLHHRRCHSHRSQLM